VIALYERKIVDVGESLSSIRSAAAVEGVGELDKTGGVSEASDSDGSA
jgi:hypothetical protein